MKNFIGLLLLAASTVAFAAPQETVPFYTGVDRGHMPAAEPALPATTFALDNTRPARVERDFPTVKAQILAQQQEKIRAMQTDYACVEAAVTPEALKACQQAAFERFRKQAQAALNKQAPQAAPAR